MTSTSITRSCDSAVVVMRSIASVAICTAVSKPNVTSVAAMSLSIVFGTPTSGSPSAASRCVVRSVPSPPTTTTASIPSRSRVPVSDAAPSPCTYGSRRDVPRIVPPRCRIPRTASRSSGRTRPSISPSHPSRMPTTSAPWRPTVRAVTPRMTAFSPGQSPPAVRIPSFFTAPSYGRCVVGRPKALRPRRRQGVCPAGGGDRAAWRASRGTSACRSRAAPWGGRPRRRRARRRRHA